MSKMNEAVKELKVLTVSKCTEDGAAYMAVLKEKDGERILPVLIERSEAFLLLMKMKGNKKEYFALFHGRHYADSFHAMQYGHRRSAHCRRGGRRNLLSRPLPRRERFSHDSLLQGIRIA